MSGVQIFAVIVIPDLNDKGRQGEIKRLFAKFTGWGLGKYELAFRLPTDCTIVGLPVGHKVIVCLDVSGQISWTLNRPDFRLFYRFVWDSAQGVERMEPLDRDEIEFEPYPAGFSHD
ncbi:TPA: hypothetical protein DF272_01030 [Candidatus Falkowbacteria bacterium]|nr:hypothetical protein [Candidatus Falkowbacteria bacterium]